MHVVHPICAGIDVHKKSLTVCLLKRVRRKISKEIRTFSTMTRPLLEMLDWLVAEGCTQVAMESTGVYWKPVFNLLEGVVNVMLVNAQHVKALPGELWRTSTSSWRGCSRRHRS